MSAMNAPLRLGFVGCGTVASRHADCLRADPRARFALFCDPNRASAEALRDQYAPDAPVETDDAVALARHPLDAVVICSPTLLHYEQVCRALEQGLHVLCEKPLAAQRAHLEDLIARRKQSGHTLTVAYQRRYLSCYKTARRELVERADWYGPVRQIHILACERWQQTITGTWRDDPSFGAGYFGDAGSHQVDVASMIAGMRPLAVLAASDRRTNRVEIVTRVIAEMSGGAGLSAHFVGDAHHRREDLHFHCRYADLLLRNERLFRCRDNQVEELTEFVAGSNPLTGFLDEVLLGRPSESPPEIALPLFDWTAAVLKSARESCWISLPGESRPPVAD